MAFNLSEILNFEIFYNSVFDYFIVLLILIFSYVFYKILKILIEKKINPYFERKTFLLKKSVLSNLLSFTKITIFTIAIYLSINVLNFSSYPQIKSIFKILIMIYFIYYIVKISQTLLKEFFSHSKERGGLNEAAVDLLIRIIRVSIIIFAILLLFSNLGYDITALLTGLGIGGLAFALAAQEILKNFFSGIILIFDKNFNKGDKVSFDNIVGSIQEVSLRTTRIRTYDGSILTVPNSKLSDGILENRTKMPKDKTSMVLGVVYDTSSKKLSKAKEIIRKCIMEEEKAVEKDIYIWFEGFSAYSLDIRVIYYTQYKQSDWPDRIYLRDRVNFRIKERFEKERIEFAFPTQTIEMKK